MSPYKPQLSAPAMLPEGLSKSLLDIASNTLACLTSDLHTRVSTTHLDGQIMLRYPSSVVRIGFRGARV